MDKKQLIIKSIKAHLLSCGLDNFKAEQCSIKAYEYYLRQVCNSKDPFKQACDHAGQLAGGSTVKGGFKYKPPVSKLGRRVKRPQDTFDF